MKDPYNWFAQGVADGALHDTGAIAFEHRLSVGNMAIDIWFRPDARWDELRRGRGMLGRMGSAPCTMEPYHEAPSILDVNDCTARAWLLHRAQCRRARKDKQPEPPIPRVWVIAAGRPDAVIERWGMRPMLGAEWPAVGVYESGVEAGPWLVVTHELPRTRDTLLVRLMGAGRSLADAWDDLHELEPDAPEWLIVRPILKELEYDQQRMGLGPRIVEEAMLRWADVRDRVWREERERQDREREMKDREREMKERLQTLEERLQAVADEARTTRERAQTMLIRQIEKRLDRRLSDDEKAVVAAKMESDGMESVAALVIDLDEKALAAWLAAACDEARASTGGG